MDVQRIVDSPALGTISRRIARVGADSPEQRAYAVLAVRGRRAGFAAAGFALDLSPTGLPSGVDSRWIVSTNGRLLSGPSIWDRSPTTRIAIFSGVMYSRATRSTSALVTASTLRLVAVELVVGKLVGDQDRELAGDAERRLEPVGKPLNHPLLGEGQLGVGDRAPAGDVGQLLEELDQRFLGHRGLHRAPGLERAGPAQERKARLGSVAVPLVLAKVHVDPADKLAAQDRVHQRQCEEIG